MKIILFVFFIVTISNFSYGQESCKNKLFLSIGTLGFNAGYQSEFDNYELTIGVKFPVALGVQSDFLMNILNHDNVTHKIGITVGILRYYATADKRFLLFYRFQPDPESDVVASFYGGVSYKLEWKNFFLLASTLIGNKNFRYPRLFYSMGYNFNI